MYISQNTRGCIISYNYYILLIGVNLSESHTSELPMQLLCHRLCASNYRKKPENSSALPHFHICLCLRPCHSEINDVNHGTSILGCVLHDGLSAGLRMKMNREDD